MPMGFDRTGRQTQLHEYMHMHTFRTHAHKHIVWVHRLIVAAIAAVNIAVFLRHL